MAYFAAGCQPFLVARRCRSPFPLFCRVVAEAEAAGMLHSAGSTANVYRSPVTVRAGFRGDNFQDETEDILDRFFGSPKRRVRVIR